MVRYLVINTVRGTTLYFPFSNDVFIKEVEDWLNKEDWVTTTWIESMPSVEMVVEFLHLEYLSTRN